MSICKVKECKKISLAKRLCNMHYKRLRRNGTLERINKRWNGEKCFYPGHSMPGMHKKRFGGLREIVIQRDGEKCVKCGMTRQDHKKEFGVDITVHHKDHQGRYSKTPNNIIDNLETLCLRCHGSKDAIKHGRYSRMKL